MAKTANALARFLKRVKEEKNLSLKKIEAGADGEISSNYVGNLLEGTSEPTISKLQALAKGIGESEDLVFEIARGVEAHSTGVHRCSDDCLAKQISDLPREDQVRLRPLLDILHRDLASLKASHRRKRR